MIKVSDFVAKRLVFHGVRHVFMITGGGAMHLNVSLGWESRLCCVYNHHEQASAIAAESYARLSGKMAAVSVTSGPGGINALNGVWGAHVDSIPMLVISGQVKYETTVRSTGLPLRQLGDQEFDISNAVSTMTKYAVMVTKPEDIQYHLDRAVYLALHGRPGPVWLDIPLNVQGAHVDEKKLRRYNPAEDKAQLPPKTKAADLRLILEKIARAERPALLVGSGMRISGGQAEFLALVKKLNIPVLTAWNANDIIPSDHPLDMGRPSIAGDRAGNFILQNSDLLLSIGSRLSIRQVGYNWKTFARAAFQVAVDIDPVELKKPTISPDLPVHADAREFCGALSALIKKPLASKENWLAYCRRLKSQYPVVLPSYWKKKGPVNPYCFMKVLHEQLAEGDIVVCGNGTACIVTNQALEMKNGMRMYTNSGCASMGYDLPAAIGACVAAGGKRIICLTGEGSIQMNLQELQTIVHNRLPIAIFLFNNDGYHSIRQTQRNFFGMPLVGVGPGSGLSFPDAGKIAAAYGIGFTRCSRAATLAGAIKKTLSSKECHLCEVLIDKEQWFEPRSASKQLPDGRIISPPLEDMHPFLDREEFRSNMIIDPVEEK